MQMIGTNGESVVVEGPDAWTLVDLQHAVVGVTVQKSESPSWWDAARLKWGYVPLDPPVEVESPDRMPPGALDYVRRSKVWLKAW